MSCSFESENKLQCIFESLFLVNIISRSKKKLREKFPILTHLNPASGESANVRFTYMRPKTHEGHSDGGVQKRERRVTKTHRDL